MNNQSNNDYDKDLSWSENPEDTPFVNKEEQNEDEKQGTFTKLIKTTAMVILALVLLIFVGIAWFTMNDNVGTNGLAVMAKSDGFELQVGSGTIGYSDLYTYLGSGVTDYWSDALITSNSSHGQMISWRFEDGDDQIQPGSQGVLHFRVISKGADISQLHYSMKIAAYVAETVPSTDEHGNPTETETVIGLDEIIDSDDFDADEKNGAKFINTHVMFFTGRTGSTKETYKYYGYINDNEDFSVNLDQDGNGTIYWIWPNTFGQIALDFSDTGYIEGTPLLDSSQSSYLEDRTYMTAHLKKNGGWDVFSKELGASDYFSNLLDTLYTKRASGQSYIEEFFALSDGYNTADQTIGANVDYILLHMTADIE